MTRAGLVGYGPGGGGPTGLVCACAMPLSASAHATTRTKRRIFRSLDLHPLVRDHALHRLALEHAVLVRGVVLQLGDRQLAPHAPDVEHERVRVEHRVLVADPLAAREHAVDLLQVLVKALLAHRLDPGEG